jgi:tRNA/rRNA methyltransferase
MAYLAGTSRTEVPPMTQAQTPQTIQPAFILVRPQMGENIGAAARAMLNFGLDRMRIVEPRDGWPNPKANALASGAGRVLDAAGIFPDVPRAIGLLKRAAAGGFGASQYGGIL